MTKPETLPQDILDFELDSLYESLAELSDDPKWIRDRMVESIDLDIFNSELTDTQIDLLKSYITEYLKPKYWSFAWHEVV